jgi:hypothetical protein
MRLLLVGWRRRSCEELPLFVIFVHINGNVTCNWSRNFGTGIAIYLGIIKRNYKHTCLERISQQIKEILYRKQDEISECVSL